VKCLGFKVKGSGFRVQDLGHGVQDDREWVRIWSQGGIWKVFYECMEGSEIMVYGLRSGVRGLPRAKHSRRHPKCAPIAARLWASTATPGSRAQGS
jgi:hypothetical protein